MAVDAPRDFDPYRVLKALVEVTAPHLGASFLNVLAEQLARLFGAEVAFVAQTAGVGEGQVRIVASWPTGAAGRVFALQGTPCELVYARREVVAIGAGVSCDFPMEWDKGFEAYLGVPLHDRAGGCIGHIAVFGRQARRFDPMIDEIARLFGRRAEAEAERLLLESERERLMTELAEANIRLLREATTDSLTGLCNRRHFIARCEEELARGRRTDAPLSLILIDLDDFKAINDCFGHPAGDQALLAVSTALQEECRQGIDLPGRIGGEEFAVLCAATPCEGARVVAERLRRAIGQRRVLVEGRTVALSASLGVAEQVDTDTWESLFRRADTALYAAKADGKNRVVAAGLLS